MAGDLSDRIRITLRYSANLKWNSKKPESKKSRECGQAMRPIQVPRTALPDTVRRIWPVDQKGCENRERTVLDIHGKVPAGTETRASGGALSMTTRSTDAGTTTITLSYGHDSRDSP